MKKIMFLLTFLLLSSKSFSQTTATNLTKCYSAEQIAEIFKGLKQGEYLKLRLEKAESTVKLGENLLTEQKELIQKLTNLNAGKDEIIANNKNIFTQEKEILSAKSEQLESIIVINKSIARKDSRKKFWQGIKIGGVGITVAGVAALLIIR